MKVKAIMKTNIITVAQDLNCYETAKLLLENKISGAPVVDEAGQLVGVVSEKDVFRGLFPSYKDFYESPESYLDFEKLEKESLALSRERLVSEIMAKRLITATPTTPILKIAAQMIASGIHRVPVIDAKNKLVGLVSRRDIYRAIMRQYLGLWETEEKNK